MTRRVAITGLGAALPAAGPPDDEVALASPASEAERVMFTASGGRRWIGEGEYGGEDRCIGPGTATGS